MGFAVAFKGVFLEGTEVVLIVVSLGAAQHRLGLAALAAAAAAVLVAVVGLLVARQLSEVPENTIKTVVGVMLTSFGVFWVGEGAGVHWPGSDLAIPVLVGFFVIVFFAFTAFMRTQLPAPAAEPRLRRRRHRRRRLRRRRLRKTATPEEGDTVTAVTRAIRAFGLFWWDFLVGDTPELALATGAIVGLAFLLAGATRRGRHGAALGGGGIPLRQHVSRAAAGTAALTRRALPRRPVDGQPHLRRLEALHLARHHEAEQRDAVTQPVERRHDGAAPPLGEITVHEL